MSLAIYSRPGESHGTRRTDIISDMVAAIKQIVTVGEGGRIEVRSDQLQPGSRAEVIVLVEQNICSGEQKPRTLGSFIGAGRGLFSSAQEIDSHLRSLRDEWER